METYYGIKISNEAIVAAINLSSTYISDKRLPEKAIDLLDQSTSNVKIQLMTKPTEILVTEEKKQQLLLQRGMMLIERTAPAKKKIEGLNQDIKKIEDELLGLYSEREIEKSSLDQIAKKQEQIGKIEEELKHPKNGETQEKIEQNHTLKKELAELQTKISEMNTNGKITTSHEVTKADIAATISVWTGIPLNSLLQDEKDKLIDMEKILGKMVIGQDPAITALSKAIRRARS